MMREQQDLILGQMRLIDLSVPLEHDAAGKGGSAGWCRAVALVPS